MKTPCKVEQISFKTIHQLPNSWTNQDYINLLEVMDYDNASELAADELKEMCMMSITDNTPEEAVKVVLNYLFKDELNSGQIDNLSNEMLEERLWEEYSDIAFHEKFFNATQLLYEAYNGKFPHPEAVHFKIKVIATDGEDLTVFNSEIEPTLIRLLVKGMPENTLINRLYHDEVEGAEFPEAQHIIWQLEKEETNANAITFSIISSLYWFKDFKYVEAYETTLVFD